MVKKDNGLNIIGVIHARGGSKRIPLKNIALLGGKPLVSYMIRAALGSNCLRRVIVSTDHPEIKKIALECGAEAPFVRPQNLAEDCPSEWVTKHAVEFVESQESKKIDIAVTMQPTTPFCRACDIDACVDLLLKDEGMMSAFTSRQVKERPEWMFGVKDGGRAELLLGGKMEGERGVFQSLPKLVIPNGAAYATRRQALFEEGVIISKNTGAHVMSDLSSVDIDEPIDLIFAEFLLDKKEVVIDE
ncbi:MAG: acylneuraminate cytidylyltransferase family protein [Candidatus Omnitrophica bacterium]|nr:acylneuraminate cytidylyltransferase family protein [Candidatus Omnitrophota bacterium]MDD5546011.1 acylneuraminate cytidylyltransferase family protein [Candidatus Omnitrophota bacterium]